MMFRTWVITITATALALFTGLVSAQSSEPDARQILEHAAKREYQDLQMNVHLVKINKRGREREMELTVSMKKTPEVAKTLAEFTAPPEAAGIKSLSWTYTEPEKPADRWFKLAGLDYTKCVGRACQNMEDRFGFSTSIFAVDMDAAEHKLLANEKIDGSPCYKIESRSKDPQNPDGAKIIIWIDVEKSAARRIETYDKDDKPILTSTFSEFMELGDHWWETKGELANHQTGKNLRFEILEAKINAGIEDRVFEKPKLFKIEGKQ